MKITEIAATSCHILKLNVPNSISAGATPTDPAGGTYSALQASWLDLKGPTSKGRRDGKEGQGRGKAEKGEGEGLCHGCWGIDAPAYDRMVSECLLDNIEQFTKENRK